MSQHRLKTSKTKPSLSAGVRVIRDELGQGKNRRSVRRALLVDKASGLLHELPTIYILRKYGQKALRTQITVLYDLAFYIEWVKLKTARNEAARAKTPGVAVWQRPEARLRAGRPALSEREITDLSGWCQSTALDLVRARQRETDNIRVLASARAVESGTTNSRLENISAYLVWLTKEMVEGTLLLEDGAIARSVYLQESLQEAFTSHMSAENKAAPYRSLDKAHATAVRQNLASTNFLPNTAAGRRDRLINRLLLATGLRAGELLKLQCGDIDDNYVLEGRTVGVIKVIRRPNDPNDERDIEPAVKTLPGPIIVSRSLASDLIEYTRGDRRAAVDACTNSRETPYLFVCHHGKQRGKPISQRNLNRIVAKLNSIPNTSATISPHVLRHTHFTEFAETCEKSGKSEKDTKEVLRNRGHWSPNSETPNHYTRRFTEKREAELVEERDRQLESNQRKT